MERLTVQIDGMSCGHCAAAVHRALAALPGVEVEHVSLGSAVIAYDPASVSVDRIHDAVRGAGYAPRPGAGAAGR